MRAIADADGRVVLDQGPLLTLDEAEVRGRVRALATTIGQGAVPAA